MRQMCSVILGCLALTNVALAQAPIVIQFSHVVTPDTPKGGKAAEYFKKLAE